jgi:hypothetical protein
VVAVGVAVIFFSPRRLVAGRRGTSPFGIMPVLSRTDVVPVPATRIRRPGDDRGHRGGSFPAARPDTRQVILTSSTRLKARDSSRGSRRAVGSRFAGRAAPSPPRAATACPAAVWCLVMQVSVWLSQTCSIVPRCGGREWRFVPSLKAGVVAPRS